MTQVKICGITEKSHALAAIEAGSDFIGLVFAPSQRQVSVAQAQEIVSAIKGCSNTTKVVGVFVNVPAPVVNKTAVACICDALASGDRVLSSQRHLYLLDSLVKGSYGGTGITSDWELFREVARRFPAIIAGGLTPETVARAIEMVSPWGVDVSSGVESNGIKDTARIKAFVGAVRRADGRKE